MRPGGRGPRPNNAGRKIYSLHVQPLFSWKLLSGTGAPKTVLRGAWLAGLRSRRSRRWRRRRCRGHATDRCRRASGASPGALSPISGYFLDVCLPRPPPVDTPSLHHKMYVLAGPTLGTSYSITYQQKGCPATQPLEQILCRKSL